MILANKKQDGIPSWIWKALIAAFFIGGVGLLLLFFRKDEVLDNKKKIYICDAEKVEGGLFIGKNGTFKKGNTQSDELSKSGKYSSKAPRGEGFRFGMGFDLKNFLPGETYKITVWKNEEYKTGAGVLAVKANDADLLYQSTRTSVDFAENGWEKMQITFSVPEKIVDWIKIETFSDAGQAVYFDDLKIELVEEGLLFADVPALGLEIKDKGLQKLKIKRRKAFSDGILVSGDDDWVKAKLSDFENEEPLDVKLRLKGDWLDHLKGDKWSFRVKVKDPGAWKRIKTFSLQTPETRYYLHEWAFHKCLEQEDILTTRYDFLQLTLNGKNKGIYAWEEHFEKQLVEAKKRREGPIVKFSEDGFWNTRRRFIKQLGRIVEAKGSSPTSSPSNAEILPFREKQTIASETLKPQFETAQNLLYQYRSGTKSAKEVFDIDRMAKYIALCEAFQALHGIIWHNQRFYYNPITQKLEPIGFDGYSGEPFTKYYFLGMGRANANFAREEDGLQRLFLDEDFMALYIKYLYKFTSRKYLNTFFNSIEPEVLKRLNWLENEYPDYNFNPSRFIELAQIIHLQIVPFEQSLKAYTEEKNGGSKSLKINNIHHLPVEIIGYGSKPDRISKRFEKPIFLQSQPARPHFLRAMHPNFINQKYGLGNARLTAQKALKNQRLRMFEELKVPESAKYLFFRVVGIENEVSTKIMGWKSPLNFTPQQELFENLTIENNEFFEIKDSVVLFKKGKHETTKDILIPANYKVFFPEGFEINFKQNAKFISKSPIFMAGTKAEPIKIYSSDGTARGFTVIEPRDSCILRHVHFSNFNTLKHKSWNLTGAVTIYEGLVALENCTFEKNNCEDGLNLVRCEFKMTECMVSETFSDGFDGDFCNGVIWNSKFLNTGNDGLDFSGSYINIHNCIADKCGDKGVSVGEESEVNLFDSKVTNSIIGVASKDFSILAIENLTIENCDQGFAAYQKKPEFGPSRILVKSYEAKNLRRLYNIGAGCSLQLPDQELIKN